MNAASSSLVVQVRGLKKSFGTNRVLDGIDLVAEPGQMVAILGATGSGKTSLANLVPRFYDPTQGKITIDGVDIRRMRKDELRRSLGLVLQDTFLFSTTVMDNIRYARPQASEAEVLCAAGHEVTCLARSPQRLTWIRDLPLRVVLGEPEAAVVQQRSH